ncbi:Biopolymer transporter [Candidatus Magnetomoraceae bacterium gMMP-15]
MEISALLKSFIYIIASSLLYPVLFMLVIMTIWIIIYSGSFFAEWIERLKLTKYPSEKLPEIIRQGNGQKIFSHRVKNYIIRLQKIMSSGQSTPVEIENMIQEKTLKIWKQMDRLRILVRVAPGLGLIGTLIPMGTGLAALGQGDMTKLTTDLVIAFTTTVVGLALGMAAFFFYTVKRRWIEEDIKNIEMATEILTED